MVEGTSFLARVRKKASLLFFTYEKSWRISCFAKRGRPCPRLVEETVFFAVKIEGAGGFLVAGNFFIVWRLCGSCLLRFW